MLTAPAVMLGHFVANCLKNLTKYKEVSKRADQAVCANLTLFFIFCHEEYKRIIQHYITLSNLQILNRIHHYLLSFQVRSKAITTVIVLDLISISVILSLSIRMLIGIGLFGGSVEGLK